MKRYGWFISTVDFRKVDHIFLEQVAYPEHRREERFLQGFRGVKATYLYQVDMTRGGVKTHWGVQKRGW